MLSIREIETYALDPANHDAFAEALARILPQYTRFQWGQPAAYKRHFLRWQEAGFTIYPNHYYSPIPDLSRLPAERSSARSNMIGLRLDDGKMLDLLALFAKQYSAEYALLSQTPPNSENRFFFGNGAFERVDAEVLHCMVRHLRPRRIIEIGSGYSSLITAAACVLNRAHGHRTEFTVIEPFPNDLFLQPIPGLTHLHLKGVEECPLSLFESLEAGDILFLDSSHVIRAGNDVEFAYFEIIPRLRPGVVIHIHDIFLPLRYPEAWLRQEYIFMNEQYLLEAMLTHNPSFEILWAGCHLHLSHPDRLAAAFPGYAPERYLPGSFWIRRC